MGIPRIYFYSFASLKDMGYMLCPGCDEQRIDVELFPWKDIQEGMAYSFVCEGCGKEISVEMKSCKGDEGIFFITK